MSITQQLLLSAVQTQLEEILIDNGYRTDSGAHVALWESPDGPPYEASELPLIRIKDSRDVISRDVMPFDDHTLEIELELVCQDGADSDVFIRQMVYDVQAAIAPMPQWGGLAIDTKLLEHTLTVDHKEKFGAIGTMKLEIYYRTLNYLESLGGTIPVARTNVQTGTLTASLTPTPVTFPNDFGTTNYSFIPFGFRSGRTVNVTITDWEGRSSTGITIKADEDDTIVNWIAKAN